MQNFNCVVSKSWIISNNNAFWTRKRHIHRWRLAYPSSSVPRSHSSNENEEKSALRSTLNSIPAWHHLDMILFYLPFSTIIQDKRIVGVTCSTDFAQLYILEAEIVPSTNNQVYHCECYGNQGSVGTIKSIQCFMHYWLCPLTTWKWHAIYYLRWRRQCIVLQDGVGRYFLNKQTKCKMSVVNETDVLFHLLKLKMQLRFHLLFSSLRKRNVL